MPLSKKRHHQETRFNYKGLINTRLSDFTVRLLKHPHGINIQKKWTNQKTIHFIHYGNAYTTNCRKNQHFLHQVVDNFNKNNFKLIITIS